MQTRYYLVRYRYGRESHIGSSDLIEREGDKPFWNRIWIFCRVTNPPWNLQVVRGPTTLVEVKALATCELCNPKAVPA